MTAELDHLVVGCLDLEAGRAEMERRLGVKAQGGGAHEGKGSRNALWGLDGGHRGPVYLELIAPDPAQKMQDGAPLPFGLHLPPIRALMASGPALLTWMARCDDIEARMAAAAGKAALGPARPMRRGDLQWRLAVPEPGASFGGVVPGLIQWPAGTTPPGAAMAGSGLRLASFTRLPGAEAASTLAALGLSAALPEGETGGALLCAIIETTEGRVTLTRPAQSAP